MNCMMLLYEPSEIEEDCLAPWYRSCMVTLSISKKYTCVKAGDLWNHFAEKGNLSIAAVVAMYEYDRQ